MKTIILEEPERFTRADTAEPAAVAPGEALVRVSRVGICGTDLHAYRGRQPFFSYPRILGHELGVEVVAVGDHDSGTAIGDRCAVEPYLNCGSCRPCRLGRTNCCEKLQVLGVHTDGGMRELIKVPVAKLHKSETLTLDQLALVETLGIGAHAASRGAIREGEDVLIIGAGPIGLSVVQFAQVAGANVVLLETNPARMKFCQEQFGVEHAIDAREQPLEQLRDVLKGELPLAVFDATGSPQSMCGAFEYVASTGRLVLVSLVVAEVSFHDPEFHRRELTVFASRNSLPEDFSRIISLMEAGTVDTKPWITHRADFDGLVEEFPSWLDPAAGVVKAMLEL